MKKIIFFIIFSLLFLFPKNSLAEFYPATAPQDQPYAIFNNLNNQFFIVWSDCRKNPSFCQYGKNDYHDIFGQLITLNGSCQGGNIPLKTENTNFTGEQFPGGVYNPNKNEYLIVWQGHKNYLEGNDSYFQQEGYDIWGQRISSNGSLIGSPFKISSLSSLDNTPKNICYGNPARNPQECDDQQWHPRVAYSSTVRRYMVVWHDGRMRARYYHQDPGYWEDSQDKTTFKDIYGQILDENGNLIGENFPVSLDFNNNDFIYPRNAKKIQQYPDIVYNPVKNHFIVVWEDGRLDPNPNPHPLNQQYDRLLLNIYGGIFDINGNPLGENFLISSNDDQEAERYPKIALNPNGEEFLVVWQSANKVIDSYPGDWVKVKARRFRYNTQGFPLPQGEPIIIENQAILHDRYLDESYPPRANVVVLNGKYLITWEKKNEGRKGRWLTFEGNLEGNPFLIESDISGSQIFAFPQGYLLVGLKRINNISTVYFRFSSQTEGFNCPLESSSPTSSPTTSPAPSRPLDVISSVGLCHQVSSLISNPNITWAYTSGEGNWRVIEPQRGVFNWTSLDQSIEKAYQARKKIWIQVLTDDPAGTIPDWALEAGMRQFPQDYCLTCYNKDRPVQWDPKYLEFLEEILDAMAQRYDNNNGPNSAIEAIIMMAGGHYGEMALHGNTPVRQKYLEEMSRITGKTTDELIAEKNPNPPWEGGLDYIPDVENYKFLFDYYYLKNTFKLIDMYASKFKNKAIILQVGGTGISSPYDSRYVVGNAVKYAVEKYGGRVWLKQNGWGNFGESDYHNFLFSMFKYQTRFIREVGHVKNLCYLPYNINGQANCTSSAESLCCAKPNQDDSRLFNTRLVNNLINAGGSAVCFQSNFFQSFSSTVFPGISDNFSNIKSNLERNYQNFYLNACKKRTKGDLNCDSLINEKDLNLSFNNWQTFWPDFNNDLKNDEKELTTLLVNWNH